MRECTYLGHIIGNGEVKPERSKLQVIAQFPLPTTKKQFRSFLGLTGYHRCFILNYASIAAPFTNLTRKSVPKSVSLSIEGSRSFSKLIELLLSSAVLKSPDFNKSLILQTDTSEVGVGVVLSQQDAEGCGHPAAFFSRKLMPRE